MLIVLLAHRPTPLLRASPVVLRPPLRCSIESENTGAAYEAGASAATAAAAAGSGERTSGPQGRAYTATLRSKPLGLALIENPSGRGAYVGEVTEGGAAAQQKAVEEGDFLVAVESGAAVTDCVWLSLPEILEAVGSAESPVTLRMRRGGPEPWQLSRDGSGLSVDDMMREAGQQYGRLMDEEQEQVLRSAFAALKDEERRAAADAATAGGYESESLRSLNRLEYDLRSFVQGARDALERVQTTIVNRVLLDSRLAVQTAEYVLRRALLDTGRVLSASRAAMQIGAAAAAAGTGTTAGERTPFVQQLERISTARQLSTAEAEGGGRALAAAGGGAQQEVLASAEEREAAEAAAEEARKQREAILLEEAKLLLREAVQGVEAWVRESEARREAAEKQQAAGGGGAASGGGGGGSGGSGSGSGAAPPPRQPSPPPPDWELLRQRANLVGGTLGEALRDGLELVREDFDAYQGLQRGGNLPNLAEQLQEAAAGDRLGRLRSFAGQETPAAQRQRQRQRREADLQAKQLRLAATVGARASKDASDVAVIGVMPGAKAVGRLAAKRLADEIASRVPAAAAERFPGLGGGGGGGGGAADAERRQGQGIVSELAREIAAEYTAEMERATTLGPLADIAEAARGPTTKMKQDLERVTGKVLLGAEAVQQKAAAKRAEAQAKRELLEQRRTQRAPAAADSPALPAAAAAATTVDAAAVDDPSASDSRSPSRTAATAAEATVTVEVAPPSSAPDDDDSVVEVMVTSEVEVLAAEEEASAPTRRLATAGAEGGAFSGLDGAVDGSSAATSGAAIGGGLVVDGATAGAEEVEVEAVDVGVVREEGDEEEERRERRARVLDAALVVTEGSLATMLERARRLVTPASLAPWELLRAFRADDEVQKQKMQKAQGEVLTGLTEGLERK